MFNEKSGFNLTKILNNSNVTYNFGIDHLNILSDHIILQSYFWFIN